MKPFLSAFWAALTVVLYASCSVPVEVPVPFLPPDFEGLHGKYVDETNTGVPAGRFLADVSSSINVTEAWIASSNGGSRIIEDKNFLSRAGLSIKTGDITVRYCKFNGKGGVVLGSAVAAIIIRDCEFDGNQENLESDKAIKNDWASLHLLRVNIHHWPRALTVLRGDTTVENCYLHDLTCDGFIEAHKENIYVAGGADQSYIGNKFLSNSSKLYPANPTISISACLAIYNQGGGLPDLERILVEDNYFDGESSYALYGGSCDGKSGALAVNTVVRGNVFGREYQRKCGRFGPVTAFDKAQPGNLWADNTWSGRGPYWVTGDPEEGDLVAAQN